MNDFRFALRSLLKTPAFTLIALITLALGIGANTSMFSVLNALLLHRPSYFEPDRLLRIYRTTPSSQLGPQSAANFIDFQAQAKTFSQLTAISKGLSNFAHAGQPAELVPGLLVSGNFFTTLGVQPLLGRALTPEDDRAGQEKVIVLSEPFWRQRFAANPEVIGQQVRIDGELVSVVGVMPAGVEDRLVWENVSTWRPLAFSDETLRDRGGHWLSVIGRLQPHATSVEAFAELSALAAEIARLHPQTNAQAGVNVAPFLRSMQDGKTRTLSLFAMSLAGCVLLIACVNLANLLFARNVIRAREHAIRAALGATRFRLIRQSLAESIVLAAVGGALGLLIATWGNAALGTHLMVADQPMELKLDWRIIGFAVAAASFAAISFGLLPALLASRTDVNDALKQGTRGSTSATHHRLRHGLIVVEVALALVLLSGAGFFIRGLDRFFMRDHGWQPAGLLTANLRLPAATTEAELVSFYERLQPKLEALPGVEKVSLSRTLPFYGFGWGQRFIVEGQPALVAGSEPMRDVNLVAPTYFDTLGITLIDGRAFNSSDLTGPMRTVIGESMARKYWPNESAIGKRIAHPNRPTEWQEVIGVVRDLKFASSLENPGKRFQTYRLLTRETDNSLSIALRSELEPAALAATLRRTVAEASPEATINNIMPALQVVELNTANYTLIGWILTAFALLGLGLAAIGLYGVISGYVAQRTTEIGIRMALGAEIRDVLRLVLGQGLRLAALGIVLGLVGVWWVASLLSTLIPALPAAEPITALAVTGALLATASLACWLPARRAASINPITAMRAD
ncbi:ABC transporter permease [Oleiharenicola lentus]|uniref:ABC transporter permease n=1 Tax=Oleiharenicola lentus TaxID=2508720 RepID=UPI003F675422